MSSQGAQSTSVRIPSLLKRAHLEKAGYWNRDTQQISEVRPCVSGGDHSACLSPAACLPLYPVLGGTGLGETRAFTSRCGVFRWEGGVFPEAEPLSRLWEYQVRELVFFGSETRIKEIQEGYLSFVRWLAGRLELPCEVATAADAFFHAESVNLAIYQLIQQTKLEFRANFETSALAVSSFNYHDKHFTHAFGIADAVGDPDLRSACVGFGLERLAYACLASSASRSSDQGEELPALEVEGSPWL